MNNRQSIALMHSASEELFHYGVLGMHWGIRRYQPYPAAYNGDGKFIGRRALKKAIREDNQKAFDKQREAHYLGQAYLESARRTEKLEKKADRLSSSKSKIANRIGKRTAAKAELSKEISRQIKKEYDNSANELRSMVSDYKKRYGQENVKPITYDKKGYVSDKSYLWRSDAKGFGKTIYSLMMRSMNSIPSIKESIKTIENNSAARNSMNQIYQIHLNDMTHQEFARQADMAAQMAMQAHAQAMNMHNQAHFHAIGLM